MGKRPSRAQASAESRRGFCFSLRKFPPDLLYFTTMLRSVPKCSFAANGICRSASSSSSAFWYTKSRNMKHGRLASEVPKGFFRAVFGVPRMRASVCSVVTLQYAFPLNPLKSLKYPDCCSWELGTDPAGIGDRPRWHWEFWGETPMALRFLTGKCAILCSYRILRIQCGKF